MRLQRVKAIAFTVDIHMIDTAKTKRRIRDTHASERKATVKDHESIGGVAPEFDDAIGAEPMVTSPPKVDGDEV